MLRIGFVSTHNPYDRNSFSGTIHYMYKALRNCGGVKIHAVGWRRNFNLCRIESRLRSYCDQGLGAVGIVGRLAHILSSSRINSINAALKKAHENYDVLIAPVASDLIGQLENGALYPPIIFVTDATHSFLAEEYGWPLPEEHRIRECKTIAMCQSVIYSSQFMADRAAMEFGLTDEIRQSKVAVIPFGLNLDLVSDPGSKPEIKDKLEIVFVGKDWHRKGGQLAIEATALLRSRGIEANLSIVGANPEEAKRKDWIKVYAYLDKNRSTDLQTYMNLLRDSHFLLLPTRADCTPMVIAEANAFRTPVICTSVGGIATLVEQGKNGFMLEPEASAEEYANVIQKYGQDSELYATLSVGARQVYMNRLNWNAWARNIIAKAEELSRRPVRHLELY